MGVPFPRPKKVKYDDLLKLCPICPSATVYDVSKSKKYYFDEQLGSLRDDYVYWLKILKEVPYAYGNLTVTISYRDRVTAVTSNKIRMIKPQWLVLRRVEKLSLIKSLYCLVYWGIVGVVREKLYYKHLIVYVIPLEYEYFVTGCSLRFQSISVARSLKENGHVIFWFH